MRTYSLSKGIEVLMSNVFKEKDIVTISELVDRILYMIGHRLTATSTGAIVEPILVGVLKDMKLKKGTSEVSSAHLLKLANGIAHREWVTTIMTFHIVVATCIIVGYTSHILNDYTNSEIMFRPLIQQYSTKDNIVNLAFSRPIYVNKHKIDRIASSLTIHNAIMITGPSGIGKKTLMLALIKQIVLGNYPLLYNSVILVNPSRAQVDSHAIEQIGSHIICVITSDNTELVSSGITHLTGMSLSRRIKFVYIVDSDKMEKYAGPAAAISSDKITIDEPTKEETVEILKAHLTELKDYVDFTISDEILSYLTNAAARFEGTTYQPIKSINLLTELIFDKLNRTILKDEDWETPTHLMSCNANKCISIIGRLNNNTAFNMIKSASVHIHISIKDTENFVVNRFNLTREILASMLSTNVREHLKDLKGKLQQLVYGQDEILGNVVKCLWRRALKLDKMEKPVSFLLIGPTGVGKCIDKRSIIWYNGGMKRIHTLAPSKIEYGKTAKINMSVVSISKDKRRLTTATSSTIYKDGDTKGYEIVTQHGYREKISRKHPIWCEIDGKLDFHSYNNIRKARSVWVPIVVGHDLWNTTKYDSVSVTTKELVKLPCGKGTGRKKALYKTKRHNITITEDIAYVLGVLLGDGSAMYDTGKTDAINKVHLTSVDMELVREVESICMLKLGMKQEIYRTKNCEQTWTLDCPILATIARELDICHTSYKKEIPDIVLSSPSSVAIAMLQGLFDTDGSALKNGQVEYCSVNKNLANDVHLILLALGILSNMRFKPNSYNGAWIISIKHHAAKFYDIVGFRLARKQLRQRLLPSIRNTNWKMFPPSIASNMKRIFKTRKDRGVIDVADPSGRRNPASHSSHIWEMWYNGKRTPSIDKLLEFIGIMNPVKDDIIYSYSANGKLVWLELESIEKCEVDLYDLVVDETHAFIANGIINHNTYIAKKLAELMYGHEDKMVRFDMSEYMEKHEISKLIGSPPGYIGSNQPGRLTDTVSKNPYAILLFDEIEKAHQDVVNIFLQVFDDGRLTDNHGKTVDFSKTIIIMTSNIGCEQAYDGKGSIGFTAENNGEYSRRKSIIKSETEKHFKPEFINRISKIMSANELSNEEFIKIIHTRLNEIKQSSVLDIEIDKDVPDTILKIASSTDKYDVKKYNAREIHRVVIENIEDKIVDYASENEVDSITIQSKGKKDERTINIVERHVKNDNSIMGHVLKEAEM